MNKEIKKMSAKEFRKLGYLQELNRCFLYPLGLAIQINQYPDGTEALGGIWDYRDDPEGLCFGIKDRTDEEKQAVKEKAAFVTYQFRKRRAEREMGLGFTVEPID